jgi:putative transposase
MTAKTQPNSEKPSRVKHRTPGYVSRGYRFRLYPNPEQEKELLQWGIVARSLWNDLVNDFWGVSRYFDLGARNGVPVTRETLPANLAVMSQPKWRYNTYIKSAVGKYGNRAPARLLKEVVRDFHKAEEKHFASPRNSRGEHTVGRPRPKEYDDFPSFTMRFADTSVLRRDLEQGVFRAWGPVGAIKAVVHRNLENVILGTHPRIIREGDGWYVAVPVEVPAPQLPPSNLAIGIDLGAGKRNALALSDEMMGNYVLATPRFKSLERQVRIAERRVARRRKKGVRSQSKGYLKALAVMSKRKADLKHHIHNWRHEITTAIARKYRLIAMEDGDLRGWHSGGLKGVRRGAHTNAPGILRQMVVYKTKDTDHHTRLVDWSGTSQTCPLCGDKRKKSLSERTHSCTPECALNGVDRDVVSAIEVLFRGLQGALDKGLIPLSFVEIERSRIIEAARQGRLPSSANPQTGLGSVQGRGKPQPTDASGTMTPAAIVPSLGSALESSRVGHSKQRECTHTGAAGYGLGG